MKVLVTGGTGYIGSHTCVYLLEQGYDIVIADDLSNSSADVADKIKAITGKPLSFINVDLKDKAGCEKIFSDHKIDGIIHFAAKKSVGESVFMPVEYYENNLLSTINLMRCMQKYNVNKIIFSSSAAVYKPTDHMPLTEDMEIGAINPYGQTKIMIEQMIKDFYISNDKLSVGILRYFNPAGAHESGLIGESPKGIPDNLMPYIVGVATGRFENLSVFGNDYDTPDGSGVRDYIHVCDLAKGHIKMLQKLEEEKHGFFTYNLGTGKGTSVIEMVKIFEEATGIKIPYIIKERRKGDCAVCYASSDLAKKELGFTAEKNVFDMCKDSYLWAKNNSAE